MLFPFQAAAYEERGVGTSDDDIVHILKQCIAVLKGARGASANPHNFSQREALLLLVHLIGDLHQPLHGRNRGAGIIRMISSCPDPQRPSTIRKSSTPTAITI